MSLKEKIQKDGALLDSLFEVSQLRNDWRMLNWQGGLYYKCKDFAEIHCLPVPKTGGEWIALAKQALGFGG